MDRASLGEGCVVRGSAWIAALGEEVVYEEDLPACCRRSALHYDESFECPACGAMWREPLPLQPEQDGFAQREERRGAA
ncbi:MAG: hypothetical protein H0W79_04955 [Rubrobacteraceae bacterium]|nr:hypothetical protein [Rubrobacteraceae bacterium]